MVHINYLKKIVILNREDYLGKCMDHINNGPYHINYFIKILLPK